MTTISWKLQLKVYSFNKSQTVGWVAHGMPRNMEIFKAAVMTHDEAEFPINGPEVQL